MTHRRIRRFIAWSALLAGMPVCGCAPAYHDYADCYIDCKYCVPPPLPYVHYEGCVCHACVADEYLDLSAESPAVPPSSVETPRPPVDEGS